MKKNDRLVLLITIGVIYLLVVGWALVSGYNYLSDSRDCAAEIKQKEVELEMVQARVKHLPQLKEEYTKYYWRAENLSLFVPSREEQERIIVSIEQMAKLAGVQIHSCRMQEKPQLVEEMPAYQVYSWQVLCSGRYVQVDYLLTLLDKADRLMKVAEINVNSKSLSDESGGYMLDVYLQLDLIVRTGG